MQLSIDTGVKSIEIIRDGEHVGDVKFSTSDPALLARLRQVSKKAEEIQQGIQLTDTSDLDSALDEAIRIDKETRSLLDWAFGSPVSDLVFGDSFCFTTSGGVTAMEQFLAGVMPIIEESFAAEVAAAKERQDKYLAKYRK